MNRSCGTARNRYGENPQAVLVKSIVTKINYGTANDFQCFTRS
jgi:hypothetical protein